MRFIGRKKIVKPNRIGLPSLVIRELGFAESEYAYVFIKNNDIYVSATKSKHKGFPVKCDCLTGRIVIPEPIKKALEIEIGNELDLYIDADKGYVILRKTDYSREIEVVRELAISSKVLDSNERREIDILLNKLKDEEAKKEVSHDER